MGAYVRLFDGRGRVLLTQFEHDYPDSGSWNLPGGGMEWGEQPEDTARRELFEETGLTATVGPVLGFQSNWITAEESWQGGPGHTLAIVFAATNPSGELRTEYPAEDSTVAAAWFDLADVRSLPRVDLVDTALAFPG
ncbi:MAG: NUDIX domain-containing protein [Actinomycetota bacterium]